MRPFATAARRRARPVVHLRPVTRAVLVAALFAIAALTSPLASPASGQSPSLELPTSPTGLTGEAAHDRVELTWDDPGDASISGYRVLRRDPEVDASGVFTTLIDDTGNPSPTYVDRDVQPEKRYVYRVQARNAAGLSPRSRRFVADTPVAPVVRSDPGVPGEQPVARAQHTCPGGEDSPEPEAVPVTAVPIVVPSTTEEYFVLYVAFDVDGTEVKLPVLVKRGEAGTTRLAENVEALPAERYRVEQYLIADPADIDGDCVDDITELGDPVGMSPVNAAAAIGISDGAVVIPDTQTYDALAVGGYLKFGLIRIDTDRPSVYFINTKTHPTHQTFLDDRSINRQQVILGAIAYNQNLVTPDDSQGGYHYSLNTLPYRHSFSLMERTHTLLAASMPLLEDNLALYVRNRQLPDIQPDLPLYRESRINLVFDRNVYSGIDFLALNPGVGYGRLQVLDPDGRPHPRNIVIYEALPNELPRVAGIITTVPQTPLSHVNLRAVQDGIPNAYIRNIRDDPAVAPLSGSYVRYEVAEDGYSVRAATKEEVDAHYEASRPQPQTPEQDLSVTEIIPLNEIGFDDWRAFGVKAANVAVLGTLDFPEGTVPDGFAIPFHFYDEFMKANGFYGAITDMLADEDFQTDLEVQDDMLDDLRDDIKDADTPQWIIDALTAMHAEFPAGQSLRYRSSTNNEDLPGFNGAGLYDSKTQDPEETAADGIDKSLKGVFASLWTFRAFTEREFHRIDHLAATMGVLVHPNYKDELANGVAVSFDPIYGWEETYYVNTQVGEDLVTNPEAHSVPEELLLGPVGGRYGPYTILGTSNQVLPGQLLLTDAQLAQLRQSLEVIHDHFEALYNPGPGEPFAMEIEFKITSDDILAIKQARPWVFGGASTVVEPPVTPVVSVSFVASSYTVTEGESVSVVVSLSADPERTLTIPLTPVGQGGASSADHSGIPASMTFESGVTSQMFDVSAAADGEVDAGESVWIGFGSLPAAVTVGSVATTTVAITEPGDTGTTLPPIFGGGGGGGRPSGPSPSTVDFEWTVKHDIDELDVGHGSPSGMWSDGTTLWLGENGDGADDAIYAYDLETGERVEDREFELGERNRAPRGVWSDRSTIWVSDSGQNKLFAHDLATGERLPDSDIELAERNHDARGIWSDEVTMWVLDGVKDSLFAYDLASGELLAEYALDSANDDPQGLWSDGVTIWVSNPDPKRLFAYRWLPVPDAGEPAEGEDEADEVKALDRVRDEEFGELSKASNNSPRGIWSDGDVMYVVDASDGKVYTYNMPDAIDTRLATLSLSGVDIGEFDGGRTEYEGVPGEGVTETTVEATTVQRRTEVAIHPTDADGDDANGHQVSLQSVEEITVTVTSADGSRTRVYRVTVERPEVEVELAPTWTSIEWPGAHGVTIADALRDGDIADRVVVVYHWDEATGSWLALFPGLEGVPGLNTLTTFTAGGTYWIAVGEPLTWTIEIDAPAER